MDNMSAERLSLSIAVGGCISSGKSTLINAICAKTYSDMQRKRTTMTPQIYCETDSELDPIYLNDIREENKACNQDIYKKGSDLTVADIKPHIYPIPKIADFTNLRDGCYLNMVDLPGLNDSKTQGVFFKYIEQNHLDFDMIVYIVDVCSALNTTDEMNILTKFLDVIQLANNADSINSTCEMRKRELEGSGGDTQYPPAIKSKQIKFLVVLNKIDEISMLDSNGDAELDEEGRELVDQAKDYISKEVHLRHLEEQYLGVTYLCAADAYIYRVYNQNPNVKLDINHINRFGMNEYGKRGWSRFTKKEKEQKVQDLMRDESGSNYNERMTACGFTNLKNIINESFSGDHQITLLLHRLSRHIHQNINYVDGPRGDIDNDIIKWHKILKLLHKIDTVYESTYREAGATLSNGGESKKKVMKKRKKKQKQYLPSRPPIMKKNAGVAPQPNITQSFVSDYFGPYINTVVALYSSVLDPKIWTEANYDSQIKYRSNLITFRKMFTQFGYYSDLPSMIDTVNKNVNTYLEHIAHSSVTFETLFQNLDTLVKNSYSDITTLAKKILFGVAGKITNYVEGFRDYAKLADIIVHPYLELDTTEQLATLKQCMINHLNYVIRKDWSIAEIKGEYENCYQTQGYLYALRVCTKHNKLNAIGQTFNDMIENLTMNAIAKMHSNTVYLTSGHLSEAVELPLVDHMLSLNSLLADDSRPQVLVGSAQSLLDKAYSKFNPMEFDGMSQSQVNVGQPRLVIERKKKRSFKSPNYNKL